MFWQAVIYFHVVARAFFLGGQLVIGLAVVPVERDASDRARLRAIARRFGYGSVAALTVLLATGVAMAAPQAWRDDRRLAALGAAGMST